MCKVEMRLSYTTSSFGESWLQNLFCKEAGTPSAVAFALCLVVAHLMSQQKNS